MDFVAPVGTIFIFGLLLWMAFYCYRETRNTYQEVKIHERRMSEEWEKKEEIKREKRKAMFEGDELDKLHAQRNYLNDWQAMEATEIAETIAPIMLEQIENEIVVKTKKPKKTTKPKKAKKRLKANK